MLYLEKQYGINLTMVLTIFFTLQMNLLKQKCCNGLQCVFSVEKILWKNFTHFAFEKILEF